MRGDKVFIYQGLVDSIVPWSKYLWIRFINFLPLCQGQAGRIHKFYSEFTEEEKIVEKSDLNSEHGFVKNTEWLFQIIIGNFHVSLQIHVEVFAKIWTILFI